MKRFKTMLAITAACCFAGAFLATAGDVPTRNTITNVTTTATAATYTVPAFGNGQLVGIQAYDCNATNQTLTVVKVVPVSSTRSLTNACATAALVATATYSLDTDVSAEYLAPGDILQFSFGSCTGNVSITRLVQYP